MRNPDSRANLHPRLVVSGITGGEVGGKRPAVAHGGRGVGSGAEAQPELRGRCSIVRELHVYGTAVAVHSRDSDQHQHQVRYPSRPPS